MARFLKRLLVAVLGLVLVVVVAGGVLLFTPILDPHLSAHPDPLPDYPAAAARIDAVLAAERELPLLENGGSISLLQGERTKKVIVIFHGYTNTPYEFRLLARAYADEGYNVWVPRLPHHALADKMTDEFSRLTTEELVGFADDQLDIAAGLGEEVTVLGLSGGGSLSLWAALERREVTRAMLISPLLQPTGYQEWMIPPMVRALRLSPVDSYAWWNAEKGADNVEGMVYPRYSLKGIAALLGIRLWAEDRVQQTVEPVPGRILLIRNDGDPSIDGDFNERLATRMVPADRFEVFRIPASAGLSHDIVCPDPEFATDAQVTEAYRQLADALDLTLPDPLVVR
jgi:carboxylesterase